MSSTPHDRAKGIICDLKTQCCPRLHEHHLAWGDLAEELLKVPDYVRRERKLRI